MPTAPSRPRGPSLAALLAAVAAGGLAGADLPFAGFDDASFGAWTVEGTAFGPGPAPGPWPGQGPVLGYRRRGLANSAFGGDAATGRLISPSFAIERPTISFLIGGGRNRDRTRIDLVIEGRVVRSSSGPNQKPAGRDALELDFWDVAEFIGRTGQLELVDEATESPWGHLLVDEIVFEDAPRPRLIRDPKRTMRIEAAYLRLPVKNGGPRRRLAVWARGEEQHFLEVQLADGEPDWWATLDVRDLAGADVTLRVDKLPKGSSGLEQIEGSARPEPDHAALYGERLRPTVHFSPDAGWLNDPNGLVFYRGRYHLFFQHNPYGTISENKHWGHATGPDLLHWEQAAPALVPDAAGYIYSGSAVVDWENTSGLGTRENPPLVLIYSAAGNPTTQRLAYSLDGGTTFTKYAGNPVLPQVAPGNRDPRVFWHAASRRWIMALYVGVQRPGKQGEVKKTDTIHFFTSPDLTQWELASVSEGFFECPDLFELPVPGAGGGTRWVLCGAGGEYQIGSFDGRVFHAETPRLAWSAGRGYYAAQTAVALVPGDPRRIRVAWLRAGAPGMNFTQALSVPMELSLRATDEGLRLAAVPVAEFERLRGNILASHAPETVTGTCALLPQAATDAFELELEWTASPEAVAELKIGDTLIRHDVRAGELISGNVRARIAPRADGTYALRAIVDRTSIELFAQEGLTVLPLASLRPPNGWTCTLRPIAGNLRLNRASAYALESIWKPGK